MRNSLKIIWEVQSITVFLFLLAKVMIFAKKSSIYFFGSISNTVIYQITVIFQLRDSSKIIKKTYFATFSCLVFFIKKVKFDFETFLISDLSHVNRRRRRDCRRSFRWQDSQQQAQNEQQPSRARTTTNEQQDSNSGMRLRSGQIKPVQIRQIKR